MRKTAKSILSMVLSAAMVLSLGSSLTGADATAADDAVAGKKLDTSFTAYLMQNNSVIFTSTEAVTDPDGTKMEGVVASSAVIDTTGTYTISAVAEDDVDNLFDPDAGVKYLGLEFAGLGMKEIDGRKNYLAPTTFSIKPKTISVTHADGTVDSYDWSKIGDGTANRLYNDGAKMPTTGKLRIGIVNAYSGQTAMDYPYANPFLVKAANSNTWTPDNINKVKADGTTEKAEDGVPVVAGETFAVTFEVSDEAPAPIVTPKPTVEPTAPPAANKYNAYLGFQTDNYIFRNPWNDTENGMKSKNYNYKSQVALPEGNKYKAFNATIKDAEITANDKQYTVSISGVDFSKIKSSDSGAALAKQFNMLFLSLDIPLTMKNVVAKNASLKIDGKVVKDKMTLPCKPDADGYYQLMIADAYSEDDGIKNCPYPKEDALKILPKSSIEVSFTLSGINFNQDFSKKVIGPKKGKTFTSGNFEYKVTKAATITAGKKAQGKVTLLGLSKKGKKAKKLTVGATVKKTGTYKISALGAKAFKGSKATSITLGKNIKKIPANAFANCKKLTKLTMKAKLSSVNKKAFTGCTKTITVSGTAKKANLKKIQKVYKKAK